MTEKDVKRELEQIRMCTRLLLQLREDSDIRETIGKEREALANKYGAIMLKLPMKQYVAINMRYFSDRKYEYIAQQFGVTKRTAIGLVSNGCSALARILT